MNPHPRFRSDTDESDSIFLLPPLPPIMRNQFYISLISYFICSLSFANGNDTIILKECNYDILKEVCLTKSPTYLKINSFKGDSLPSQIGKLNQLENLEVNFGEFHSIPKSIGKLTRLKKLTISNGLTRLNIPSEIGQLINLVELNIYNYKIEFLPTEIGNLVNLEDVMLCGKLESLPESVKNWKSIKKMYLAGNDLKEIPTYFYLFSELESLDISRSDISAISDSIKYLKRLRDLTLDGNIRLDKLPESLCELENLERLSLINTMISSLTNCFSETKNLTEINLCKELFPDYKAIDKVLSNKIEWNRRCRYLESKLIDFSEAYGTYNTKLSTSKDTLCLESNYFYNEPRVIDEEFSMQIVIKTNKVDSIILNTIYEVNNPIFEVKSSSFSIWDWSDKKNYELVGYIVFREISNKKVIAYLNIEIIENENRKKIIDRKLEFKK